MANKLDFVLRVLAGELETAALFLGTGILVAPDRVLTCRHLVLDRDPMGRATDVLRSDLQVETSDGRQVDAKHPPFMDPAWDLALLELEHPLGAEIPPFLWGLTRALEPSLRSASLSVIGYAQVEHHGPLWQHPVGNLFRLASYREGSETLTQLQLSGGIPAGCSGAPALLPMGDNWAYVGTVYLGGERAAASRLIMADPVVEFLAKAGLEEFSMVDATRALAVSPLDARVAEQLIERPENPLVLPNPYRGLQAFREVDAPYFHGRETESEALFDAVQNHPLVTLAGASGSGKSSLVVAGLLPRLRQLGGWRVVEFRPRMDPFKELAGALTASFYTTLDLEQRAEKRKQLSDKLIKRTFGLADLVAVWSQENAEKRLLLVADQFEELYTQPIPDASRKELIDQFTELIQESLPCTLLLSLRADFLGQLLDSALSDAFKRYAKQFLGPMNEEALRAAIDGPARQLGVVLEPGLTERIVQDLDDAPGSLPLLEFALTELWTRQERETLTHAAYDDIGGVREALSRHADEVLERFQVQKERLRRIFVQLVRPGEGTEDTRQLATREQVGAANWPLVVQLAAANNRLVVTGRDESNEQQTVEIVHEALIQHWEPLRRWMAEDRAFRVWQNRLRQSMQEWEAKQHDEGALLRGARLSEAEEQYRERRKELSAEEQTYIQASVDLREREAVAREAQRQRELDAAQKLAEESEARRRAQRQTIFGLVAGLLLTLVLAGVASVQWRNSVKAESEARIQSNKAKAQSARARTASAEADRQSSLALARQLAAQSTLALSGNDLVKSALLATQSLKSTQTIEGYQAWAATMELLPRGLRRLEHEGEVRGSAFSPDGNRLATATSDRIYNYWNIVTLWDTVTGKVSSRLKQPGKFLGLFSPSPNGRIITWRLNGKTVVLWDVTTKTEIHRLDHDERVTSIAFSPDSLRLVTGDADGTVRVWSIASGKKAFQVLHEGSVRHVAFSPDGAHLVTASRDGTFYIVDAKAGNEVRQLELGPLYDIAFDVDGRRLATVVQGDTTVHIRDFPAWSELFQLNHKGVVKDVIFSRDGSRVATASQDHTARIWDATSGAELVRFQHTKPVLRVVLSPDNRYAATVDGYANSAIDDGHVWDVGSGKELFRIPDAYTEALAFSPDGRHLAAVGGDNRLRLWDVPAGKELSQLTREGEVRQIAYSPDGKWLAAATRFGEEERRGQVQVWDLTANDEPRRLGAEAGPMSDVTFSKDGTLLAASSWDGKVWVWDVQTDAELARFEHADPVVSLSFSADGKRLTTVSDTSPKDPQLQGGVQNYRVQIWDLAKNRQVARLADAGGVEHFKLFGNGKYAATSGGDNEVRIWDTATGKEIDQLKGNTSVQTFEVSPGGEHLATIEEVPQAVHLWNINDGRVVTRLAHDAHVKSMRFSPDGRRLATVSDDKTVRLWDVATGREIRRLVHESLVHRIRISQDGNRLAALTSKWYQLWFWDLSSGELIARLNHPSEGGHPQNSQITHFSFSSDSTRLLTGGWQRTVRIWDASTGKVAASLTHMPPPSGGLSFASFNFSPDGRQVVTWSADKTARIWNIHTGDEILRLEPAGGVGWAKFSPDGTRVVTKGDNRAQVWDPQSGELLVQLAHVDKGSIYDINFSSDGTRLATAGKMIARVWDLAKGSGLTRLKHNGRVHSVSFINESKKLLTFGTEGVPRVWDASSGEQLFTLAHEGKVDRTAYCADGSRVATTNAGLAQVWDVGTGDKVAEISTEEALVRHLALSPDGKHLVTEASGANPQLWDVETGEEVHKFNPVLRGFAFDATGTRIATTGDGAVRVWDISSGHPEVEIPYDDQRHPSVVSFSPDGTLLAAAGEGLTLWHLETREKLAQLPSKFNIEALAFSSNGRWLTARDGTETIRMWTPVRTQPELLRVHHGESPSCIALSRDGKRLASVEDAKPRNLRIWDLDSGEVVFSMPYGDVCEAMKFSPDGTNLTIVGSDKSVRLLDALTGSQLARLVLDESIQKVVFSPQARQLATIMGTDRQLLPSNPGLFGGSDERVQIWDLITGERTRLGAEGYVNDVVFSPKGDLVATAEGGKEFIELPREWIGSNSLSGRNVGLRGVRVWNAVTGEELMRLPHTHSVEDVLFSPDGGRLASVMTEGIVQLWDTGNWKPLVRLNAHLKLDSTIMNMRFSPEGRFFGASTYSQLTIWEVSTGKQVARFARGPAYSPDLAFSPSGRYVAETSEFARIWDVAAGREVARFPHGYNRPIRFTPDGHRIVTTGKDGTARVWFWRAEDLVAEACSRLERNLTHQEWQTYLGEVTYMRTCDGLPIPD